ncbi:MAG: nucleoside deaminase [Bacteroidales bacterium]|nr:nucleoside deaminase [Bacteroidales bacterium]
MENPDTDSNFMRIALKEALRAEQDNEVPIGAVIVCNGKIIARTYNQTEKLNDPTAHAELLAITAATNTLGSKYLTDCTLYVTVEPCVMCAGALGWAQIGRVVFGTKDEKRGFLKFAPRALHPKTTLTQGVLEPECASLITKFFQNRRQ